MVHIHTHGVHSTVCKMVCFVIFVTVILWTYACNSNNFNLQHLMHLKTLQLLSLIPLLFAPLGTIL